MGLLEFNDDVPWLRPLTFGELVDSDYYLTLGPDLLQISCVAKPEVSNLNGTPYTVRVLDDTVSPPTLTLDEATVPGIPLTATLSGASYTVGSVYGVLTADPRRYYSDIFAQMVGRFPFNESPLSDLECLDCSAYALTAADGQAQVANFDPEDRVWDAERGWVLQVAQRGTPGSSTLRHTKRRNLADFSTSFWINPTGYSDSFYNYGPMRLHLRPQETFSVHLAAVGDVGYGNVPSTNGVEALVKASTAVDVLLLGDVNYETGSAGTIDVNLGAHWRKYLFPFNGNGAIAPLRAGETAATSNHLWAVPGNHDWGNVSNNPTGLNPWLAYFAGTGVSRYYVRSFGAIDLFFLDSDINEPDGRDVGSVQYNWLLSALAASTAKFKGVVFHHTAESSGLEHPPTTVMQYDFASLGVDFVLSGHNHNYERWEEDGVVYFTVGTGGPNLNGFVASPSPYSRFRAETNGALFIDGSSDEVTFKFKDVTGAVLDERILSKLGDTQPTQVCLSMEVGGIESDALATLLVGTYSFVGLTYANATGVWTAYRGDTGSVTQTGTYRATVPLDQDQSVIETFAFDGVPGGAVALSSYAADLTSDVYVTVDGVTFTRESSIGNALPTDLVFATSTLGIGGQAQVVFGDGVHGAYVRAGQAVQVSYSVSGSVFTLRADAPFLISDLYFFNVVKTQAQLEALRAPILRPTNVRYSTRTVSDLGGRTRYEFVALSNGLVYPSVFNGAPDDTEQAWMLVHRYDGRGKYVGDDRRELVGMTGTDKATMPTIAFGSYQPSVRNGQIVVAGTQGLPGGLSEPAATPDANPYVRRVVVAGTVAYHPIAQVTSAANVITLSPVPDKAHYPVVGQYVAIGADAASGNWHRVVAATGTTITVSAASALPASGELYLATRGLFTVTLSNVLGVLKLVAVPLLRASDIPGVALPNVSLAGMNILTDYSSVAVYTMFSVVRYKGNYFQPVNRAESFSGTLGAPDASSDWEFLPVMASLAASEEAMSDSAAIEIYGNNRLEVVPDGAGWKAIQLGLETAGTQNNPLYIYLTNDIVVDVTDAGARWVDGIAGQPATLTASGDLIFVNTEVLPAGQYQLTVDAGNLGLLDQGFSGYQVDVTIGYTDPLTVVSGVLLPTASGQSPRGPTTLSFLLAEDINAGGTCEWTIDLHWSNDLPSNDNFQRTLAVYGYTLTRLTADRYKVTTGIEQVISFDPSGEQGAWLADVMTDGTLSNYTPEANVFGLTALYPNALVITGSTSDRIERIIKPFTVEAQEPTPGIITAFTASASPASGSVGDAVTFTAAGLPSPTDVAWIFWDGDVRYGPVVSKALNVVASVDTLLTATVRALDHVGNAYGQTTTVTTLAASMALELGLGSDGLIIPFTTIATVTFALATSVSYTIQYLLEGVLIATVATGIGVTFCATSLSITTPGDSLLTAVITAAGKSSTTLYAALSALPSLPPDISPVIVNVPSLRQGLQTSPPTYQFSVFATDPVDTATVTVAWTVTPTLSNSYVEEQAGGGMIQSNLQVNLANSNLLQDYVVRAVATSSRGTSAASKFSFRPVANGVPVINAVILTGPVVPATQTTLAEMERGKGLLMETTATDPEYDALTYMWSVNAYHYPPVSSTVNTDTERDSLLLTLQVGQSILVLNDNAVYLLTADGAGNRSFVLGVKSLIQAQGRTAYVSGAQFSAGGTPYYFDGLLTVTDALGATATQVIVATLLLPRVNIPSVRPPGGSQGSSSAVTVTLGCSTVGASVRYLVGADPEDPSSTNGLFYAPPGGQAQVTVITVPAHSDDSPIYGKSFAIDDGTGYVRFYYANRTGDGADTVPPALSGGSLVTAYRLVEISITDDELFASQVATITAATIGRDPHWNAVASTQLSVSTVQATDTSIGFRQDPVAEDTSILISVTAFGTSVVGSVISVPIGQKIKAIAYLNGLLPSRVITVEYDP